MHIRPRLSDLSLIFNLWVGGWAGATLVDHECSPRSIVLLSKEEDQHEGCGGESARS